MSQRLDIHSATGSSSSGDITSTTMDEQTTVNKPNTDESTSASIAHQTNANNMHVYNKVLIKPLHSLKVIHKSSKICYDSHILMSSESGN